MVEPTEWLARLQSGDQDAADELFPLVYAELRRLAHSQMRDQSGPSTLQTTALVHEAWIRLAGHAEEGGEQVLHFRALAARAMRSVLVDHARAKASAKRGGDWARITLTDDRASNVGPGLILDLDEALNKLASVDEELVRIAELRCFSGLEHGEIAQLLGFSTKTAERRWKSARAWLQKGLEAASD